MPGPAAHVDAGPHKASMESASSTILIITVAVLCSSMDSIFTSWPFVMVGTILLGVGTNLIMPSVARILSAVNAKRKTSTIAKIVGEYEYYLRLNRKGIAIFGYTRFLVRSLAFTTIYLFLSMLLYLDFSFRNVNKGQESCIVFSEHCAALKPYTSIIYTVMFIMSAGWCIYMVLRDQQRASRLVRSTGSPIEFHEETLMRIRRIDEKFDESRLKKPTSDRDAGGSAAA